MKIALQVATSRWDDLRILPMINVVFLLLIFLMLVGTVSAPDLLPVQPPASAAGEPVPEPGQPLLLSGDGRLAFGGELLDERALSLRVGLWRVQNPGLALQLKADANVAAAQVVRVLEQLRAAGAAKVVLITAPPRLE